MQREQALSLVREKVEEENLVKHMLAVEAIMRKLAEEIGQDPDRWGITGLVHDVDYSQTKDQPEKHTLVAEDILKDKVEPGVITTIKAHNFGHTGVEPETKESKALVAADALSGLVIACALVMPSKKLEEVRVETIEKKFKQKDFARNCSRERIMYCEKIGLDRKHFFELSLEALQSVSDRLGL